MSLPEITAKQRDGMHNGRVQKRAQAQPPANANQFVLWEPVPLEEKVSKCLIERSKEAGGKISMCLDVIEQAERESIEIDDLSIDTQITFDASSYSRAEFEQLL